MDVLALLYARAGAVVSADEILERVWEGRAVSAHSVATVVSELRKALGDDTREPRYIETVPKRGYRLIAATEPDATGRGRRRAVTAALAVGAAAVAVLGVSLALPSRNAADPVVTSDPPEQLERLFQARQLWSRRDDESVPEAVAMLTGILEADPGSAAAHATLAMIYAHKTGEHLGMPALDTFREAQRHLDRARDLAPELPDVDVAQALLDFYRDHQPRKALASIDRALERDPDSSLAWQDRAMVASALGHHDESLRSIERAAELDPVSPSIAWDRVWFLYLARRQEDARTALQQVERSSGRNLLYEALIARAFDEPRRALDLWVERSARLGFALPAPGRVAAEADGSLPAGYAELLRQTAALPAYHDYPGVRAIWQLESGDPDAALATLTDAPPSRDNWMVLWLRELPAFDALHGRAEFEALVARTGVTTES